MTAKLSADVIRDLPAQQAMMLLLHEIKRRGAMGGLDHLYPDTGPLRRELYPKHIRMFAAGKTHKQRVAMGGNRVGKSYIGAYETALHLTGLYPHWWPGYRFDRPILAWGCGTKADKVRDVNQKILCGKLRTVKSVAVCDGGLIPQRMLKRALRKNGVLDAIDQIEIQHSKGWTNTLAFKSYEQGRQSFEAEAVDFAWLDEEPTKEIYDEVLMRLLTTKGIVLSTLTPVEGLTECVVALLEDTEFI